MPLHGLAAGACLMTCGMTNERLRLGQPAGRKSTTRAKTRSETSEPIAHDLADGDCTNPFGERVLNRFRAWRSGMKTFSNVANQCH
jgi:hypothetical protein